MIVNSVLCVVKLKRVGFDVLSFQWHQEAVVFAGYDHIIAVV